MKNIIVTTERLFIRELTLDDAQALIPIFGDQDVMLFSRVKVMTLEQIQESLTNFHLKCYKTNGFGMYAIIQKSNNNLIGICGFFIQVVDTDQRVELAYRLAKKYWGMGFATEAALAVKNYGHSVLGIKTLISIIDPENAASIRVAKKIGMVLWQNSVVYDIPALVYLSSASKQKKR